MHRAWLIALGAAVAAAAIAGCGSPARDPVAHARVPSAASGLERELAVLRRAQTPADRSLPAAVARPFGGVVRSLTRIVATVHATGGVYRVYLVVSPAHPCGSSGPVPAGGDGASLITVGPRGRWGFGMGFSAGQLERFAIIPTGLSVVSSVIPDGVTSVRWVFDRWHPGSNRPGRVTVNPKVHENVAVTVTPLYETQADAAWRFSDGRVLTSRREAASLVTCPEKQVLIGGKQPIAPWLKRHFGLFRSPRLARALPLGIFYARYLAGWRLGLNSARARFVWTGIGMFGSGSGVWVIPGNRGACVMEGTAAGYEGGNGVCAPRDGYSTRLYRGLNYPAPESGGLRFSDRDGRGRNTYSGLVPDGNRTVSVILAGGTIRRVAVVDNVYSLTVNGRALAVIDKDTAGHRERFPLFVNNNMF